MKKILCILLAVLVLGAVIDCKVGVESGTNQANLCSVESCVNGQNNIRQKRANGRAVEILGGVERLVTSILNSTLGRIPVKKPKGEERVIIGGGSYNDNTVTLDDYDYE